MIGQARLLISADCGISNLPKSLKPLLLRRYQITNRSQHIVHRHRFHTSVIGGALTFQAGGALEIPADDAVLRHPRVCRGMVGGAENGDNGDIESCCDMHRARIIADHQAAAVYNSHHLPDGGPAYQVQRFSSHKRFDIPADFRFSGSTGQDNAHAVFVGKAVADFGEALGDPTFGGSVGGSGINCNTGAVLKLLLGPLLFGNADFKILVAATAFDAELSQHVQVMP